MATWAQSQQEDPDICQIRLWLEEGGSPPLGRRHGLSSGLRGLLAEWERLSM